MFLTTFYVTAAGLQVLRDNNIIHRDLKPQVCLILIHFSDLLCRMCFLLLLLIRLVCYVTSVLIEL